MLDLLQVLDAALVLPARGILDDATLDEGNVVGVDVLDRLDLQLLVVVTGDLDVKCGHFVLSVKGHYQSVGVASGRRRVGAASCAAPTSCAQIAGCCATG